GKRSPYWAKCYARLSGVSILRCLGTAQMRTNNTFSRPVWYGLESALPARTDPISAQTSDATRGGGAHGVDLVHIPAGRWERRATETAHRTAGGDAHRHRGRLRGGRRPHPSADRHV